MKYRTIVADPRWEAAVERFEAFRVHWYETPGGTRAEGVQQAFAADEAIEALPESVVDSHHTEVDLILERLEHVPEVEKRWFGLAEYKRNHRVRDSWGDEALEHVEMGA